MAGNKKTSGFLYFSTYSKKSQQVSRFRTPVLLSRWGFHGWGKRFKSKSVGIATKSRGNQSWFKNQPEILVKIHLSKKEKLSTIMHALDTQYLRTLNHEPIGAQLELSKRENLLSAWAYAFKENYDAVMHTEKKMKNLKQNGSASQIRFYQGLKRLYEMNIEIDLGIIRSEEIYSLICNEIRNYSEGFRI